MSSKVLSRRQWLKLCPVTGAAFLAAGAEERNGLWSHIHSTADLGELRGMNAEWDASAPGGLLTLTSGSALRYPSAVIPAPKGGWDLARRAAVEAEITNRSTQPVDVLLWVVGDRGWDAVPASAKLEPGETKTFSCQLRETFPDGTPKLDPTQVKQVQVMLPKLRGKASLEVRGLVATGAVPEWIRPIGRIDVPSIQPGPPAPGSRVRYQLAGDEHSAIYSLLYLPTDWKAGASYPVIVEYPGNIFFTPGCYSTGLPDQCVIGYGMMKGRGAIWLSLPFVDRRAGNIAENGWGNPDDTADYAVRMVDEVCAKFGGDRSNVVLTGFSRGAIACGFIGLRNDRIASLWKGFHACQHSDGDSWNGASMEGAVERAGRFRGVAVFHTDNSPTFFRPVMDAMKTKVTFAQSGLGAHACAMFLDDRPSTQQLRQWFAELVGRQRTP